MINGEILEGETIVFLEEERKLLQIVSQKEEKLLRKSNILEFRALLSHWNIPGHKRFGGHILNNMMKFFF